MEYYIIRNKETGEMLAGLLIEQENEPIWEYHPKFCPNCGRRLLENELKARGGRNDGN